MGTLDEQGDTSALGLWGPDVTSVGKMKGLEDSVYLCVWVPTCFSVRATPDRRAGLYLKVGMNNVSDSVQSGFHVIFLPYGKQVGPLVCTPWNDPRE